MKLSGCYTALATPFRDGRIDWDSFSRLIRMQLDAGVAGVVPCGTTGESPTLLEEEHDAVVAFAVKEAGGRCAVLAGTGSNSTRTAVERTKHAREAGANAALVVTPYYNKPTQEGLFRHYEAIAKAAGDMPVVLYEIPGRTGVSLDIETCARLAAIRNVVAIKEASGKIERVLRLRETSDLTVLSGDDSMTLPMMALGAAGVVSVASNVAPGEVAALVAAAAEGRLDDARRKNDALAELFRVLFLETNPSPVKYALKRLGTFASDELRLPLVPVGAATRQAVDRALERLRAPAHA